MANIFLSALVASVFAAGFSTPADVIKSRMQNMQGEECCQNRTMPSRRLRVMQIPGVPPCVGIDALHSVRWLELRCTCAGGTERGSASCLVAQCAVSCVAPADVIKSRVQCIQCRVPQGDRTMPFSIESAAPSVPLCEALNAPSLECSCERVVLSHGGSEPAWYSATQHLGCAARLV